LWTGDQGIFVDASALLFKYMNDLQTLKDLSPPLNLAQVSGNLTWWLTKIPNGIYNALTNFSSSFNPTGDNILREAPFECFFGYGPGDDPNDYVCGRGVLARFFTSDATLAAFRKINGPSAVLPLRSCYIQTSAAIAKTGKDNSGQIQAEWATAANNEKTFVAFQKAWGAGGTGALYNWQPTNTPTWNNYCMMMGFDFYSAYLKMNWFPPAEEEKKHGHKD
jgi:hypothetical protein